MKTFYKAFGLAVVLIASSYVSAQDNSQAALTRAQGMLRQISSQKAALEAQVAQLQLELDAARSELESQKKKADKKEGKYKGAISEWKQEYSSLKEKFYQTIESLRQTANERDDLSVKLAATTQNFETCFEDNHQLVKLNRELLGEYQDKGFWAALSAREPVTGFGKVKQENLLQTYSHALDDLDLGMNGHALQKVDQ